MKIVFATNNKHKLDEVRAILGEQIEVLSLADIGCHDDIPETGRTLEENALQKARYIWDHYHLPCFADDTGLEVEALGGAPGVFSARYAAVRYAALTTQHAEPHTPPLSHDSQANMSQLLRDLGECTNRRARFRTVIALIEKVDVCPCGCTSVKREHLFEGIVEGEITRQPCGSNGFGYDPVFRPEGFDNTFAELPAETKNAISHRARATAKLCEFLKFFYFFSFLVF